LAFLEILQNGGQMANKPMHQWATEFWDALAQDEQTSEEEGFTVFRGHPTKILLDIGASAPYYSILSKRLEQMECIERMHRGGGGGFSVWRLLKRPTKELWQGAEVGNGGQIPKGMTAQELSISLVTLTQRVSQLETAIKFLNGQTIRMLEALEGMEIIEPEPIVNTIPSYPSGESA